MHRLLVLYLQPADPGHFRSYYEKTHLPMAAKLPGLRGMRHSFTVHALAQDRSPYFASFEADFDSEADLLAALSSPEGRAVAADVANYASGGAELLHYQLAIAHAAPSAGASPGTATNVDPREVLLTYLQHFNTHDVAAIGAMFAEDGTYTDPSLGGTSISGQDLTKHLDQLFGAVPDLHLRVLCAAAHGDESVDTAVAYWYMSGTATGPNTSSNGGIYNMAGGDILHIDAAGKILWTEALYDQKTFFEQGGFA